MRALSASELLYAWERALGQSPARRALLLLEAACAGAPEQLAELSIGQRDARLLAVRESTFGPHVAGAVCCSSCGERLELSFAASDLVAASDTEQSEHLELCADGYEISFRAPNSLDLIAASNERDRNLARACLLGRCISTARRDGHETEPGSLPESIIDAIAARMAEADPQADLYLAFKCPACGNRWRLQFDIESFFWTEINAWAARMLNEVHILASAYKWSEAEILGMSARRRQCYLNLVNG